MSDIVLLDYMNTLFINFNMSKRLAVEEKIKKGEEPIFTKEDIPFFYHLFFKKLNQYIATYGNITICLEGYNSLDWRRSIFPDYKRNRDKGKTENDYKLFKESLPAIEQVLSFYPCRLLKIDRAEADDIIYTLSEKYKNENVTIISSDNDFSQIINKFENVKLFNPVKLRYVEKQPNILLEKAIVGDISDNIPGLNKIGIKTFNKMMEDKLFFNEKMKNGNKEIVDTYLKIIDLSKIPSDIKQEILDEDERIGYNNFIPDEIETFYFSNKLKELLMTWANVKGDIELSLRG